MKMQMKLNGTPEQVARLMLDLKEELAQTGDNDPFELERPQWLLAGDDHYLVGTRFVEILIRAPGKANKSILATVIADYSNDRTPRLTLAAKESEWMMVEEGWDLLRRKLKQEALIAEIYLFKGTPHRFGIVTSGISKEREQAQKNAPRFIIRGISNEDEYMITVMCGTMVTKQEVEHSSPWLDEALNTVYGSQPSPIKFRDVSKFEEWGQITAQIRGDGKSELGFAVNSGNEKRFQKEWEFLIDKMSAQGWIENANVIPATTTIETHGDRIEPKHSEESPSKKSSVGRSSTQLSINIRRKPKRSKKRERTANRGTLKMIKEALDSLLRQPKQTLAQLNSNGSAPDPRTFRKWAYLVITNEFDESNQAKLRNILFGLGEWDRLIKSAD